MSNKEVYDYGQCHVCGEQMEERQINQHSVAARLVVSTDRKLFTGIFPRIKAGVPVSRCLMGGERRKKDFHFLQNSFLIAFQLHTGLIA